jgi:hypothetical protein
MKGKAQVTCYACDNPATTKEHAPPFSFFPEGQRNDLITVPSCADHNNANSKDVEYTRNVITIMFGVNEIGQQHFSDKSLRSFDHSPALLYSTFSDIRPVRFQGMTVGKFTVDTARIEAVMGACICALHFRETGTRKPKWGIILPNLFLSHDTTPEAVSSWGQFLSMLNQIPFTVRQTNSPDIFEYAVADLPGAQVDIPGGRVYCLRFYKGFLVYALELPYEMG